MNTYIIEGNQQCPTVKTVKAVSAALGLAKWGDSNGYGDGWWVIKGKADDEYILANQWGMQVSFTVKCLCDTRPTYIKLVETLL